MRKHSIETPPQIHALNLVLLLLLVFLSACQKMPETSGNVENPDSHLLGMLLQPADLPGNWRWTALSVNQPSQVQWIDQQELVDSARTSFAGVLQDDSENQFYISVFQTIAQYSIPVSLTAPISFHSSFDEISSSFIPELDLPAHSRLLCFESSEFIDCEVTGEFKQVLSVTLLITPNEFGKQATTDLIETLIQTIEDRIDALPPQ